MLFRSGTPDEVPPQTALGLYRIAQESLSNVAKHQPRGRTVVVLEADATSQELQVWNTLPSGTARTSALVARASTAGEASFSDSLDEVIARHARGEGGHGPREEHSFQRSGNVCGYAYPALQPSVVY
mgnify:CR=1 FL=1